MRTRLLIATALSLVLPLTATFASDPPDSRVNAQTGNIEIADPVWSGTNYDIRYVVNNSGIQDIFTVTDNALDDLGPRMTIAANGDAWVVWWRDDTTPGVLVRERTWATGTWSAERSVGQSGESAHNPVIEHDGTDAWVAYEIDRTADVDMAVGVITDEPEPIGRTIVGSSSFSGSRDLALHAESGSLWVTWVDSSTHVAWSEYDSTTDTWSTKATESYASDTIEDARDRVRTTILNP